MDAKDLKGMAVVTIAEAAKVGRVDDVMFDTTPLRARGLRLMTETGSRMVGLADVESVGPDAIVTADAGAAHRADATLLGQGLLGFEELKQLKVVDQGGQYVGHIEAVDVDAMTGDVIRVEVRKGDILGVGGQTTALQGDDVVSIGPELVTVRRTT